jgi:hypothetical protein
MSPILGARGGLSASAWGLFSPSLGLPNSYESLQTVNVGSGGQSTISFTSIPSTYKHLQIRYSAQSTVTSNPTVQFNSDTAANYSWHITYGQGTGGASVSGANQSFIYLGTVYQNTSVFSGGVIDILDYANTNKNKTVKILCGGNTNAAGEVGLFSGNWRNTTAITSVQINLSNFTQHSKFALYGIKE